MLSLFAIINTLIVLGVILLFAYIAISILKTVKQTNEYLKKMSEEMIEKK